jgi:prophage antirepressor-like protein
MTNLIENIDMSLSFNDNTVRVFGTFEEPLFVVKDVCDILGLTNTTKTLEHVDEEYNHLLQVNTSSSGLQSSRVVSEPGLYQIIMRCRKEVAKPFQKWVCGEVLPSLRKKGEYKMNEEYQLKLKEIEEEKLRLEEDNKLLIQNHIEKDNEIKNLQNKILTKQNRIKYKEKNCIYLLTTDFHLENKTYIIGKTVDLTQRLTCYNKTVEHTVVYTKGCKSADHMHVAEKMVLYKLDKYRERNNRDRFILPEDKDITFFINVVNDAISWFDDIDEYVHLYTDAELDLTDEELQENYKKSIEDREEELKNNKSETDRKYRENNKDQISEINKTYRENNKEKIAENKKEYYDKNKTEILNKQKVYYEKNKPEILERQKEYHNINQFIINHTRKIYREENKDKIKEQKKVYREKYKEEINKKQNEKRACKENPTIQCECGVKLKLQNIKSKKHINSKAHVNYLKDKNNDSIII